MTPFNPAVTPSMRIAVVNGPNLNRLGHRDISLYGPETLRDTMETLREGFPGVEFDFFQSNSEGEVIDFLQSAADTAAGNPHHAGIVINPGAYAHYSLAIADAMRDCRDCGMNIVEVHISNIHARDGFRRKSVTAEAANAVVAGCGRNGYALAVNQLLHLHRKQALK